MRNDIWICRVACEDRQVSDLSDDLSLEILPFVFQGQQEGLQSDKLFLRNVAFLILGLEQVNRVSHPVDLPVIDVERLLCVEQFIKTRSEIISQVPQQIMIILVG